MGKKGGKERWVHKCSKVREQNRTEQNAIRTYIRTRYQYKALSIEKFLACFLLIQPIASSSSFFSSLSLFLPPHFFIALHNPLSLSLSLPLRLHLFNLLHLYFPSPSFLRERKEGRFCFTAACGFYFEVKLILRLQKKFFHVIFYNKTYSFSLLTHSRSSSVFAQLTFSLLIFPSFQEEKDEEFSHPRDRFRVGKIPWWWQAGFRQPPYRVTKGL